MDKDDDDDDDDDDEDMVVRQTCIWYFNQFFTCIFHKCLFTDLSVSWQILFIMGIVHKRFHFIICLCHLCIEGFDYHLRCWGAFVFWSWQKKSEDDQPKLSKKKLRKMNRLSVAELKQVCVVLFGKLHVVKALFDCDFIKTEEWSMIGLVAAYMTAQHPFLLLFLSFMCLWIFYYKCYCYFV